MKGTRLMLILILLLLLPISANAEEVVPICTPQELAAIAENPTGSYVLMEDLDMAGIPWKSLDFSGTLDGKGHAILNLELAEPSDQTPDAMDGNNKTYPASYVGLFGTLVDAQVKDLKLINVQGRAESDAPVFLAAMAGYCKDSTISDCTISGTLELRACDRMYGVGGIIGYGSGWVERCQVDVTMICTDTDQTSYCEQFLGGVFAAGFVDVLDSHIHLRGYCSEYGYVHCGGIGGLYMQYPLAMMRPGYITGNQVSGSITFFEKNKSRRAYCEPFCGEILAHNYHIRENTEEFHRDERLEYDVELRPEMCPQPEYTEVLVPSGCGPGQYGYTEFTCTACGQTFRDDYTLLQHQVSSWTLTIPATFQMEGRSTGNCSQCGMLQERVEPRLPEPSSSPTSTPTSKPQEESCPMDAVPVFGRIGSLLLILLTVLGIKLHRRGKYSR